MDQPRRHAAYVNEQHGALEFGFAGRESDLQQGIFIGGRIPVSLHFPSQYDRDHNGAVTKNLQGNRKAGDQSGAPAFAFA